MNRNTRYSDIDDETLVAQAIKELPYVTIAYEALIQRHYPLIFRTCQQILKDSGEAEELCQIVMLKVFRGLPKFQARSSFKTWLVRVATNACYSRHQQLKLERQRYRDMEEGDNSDTENNESGEAPGLAWLDNFDTLVSGLNDKEKKIICLRFVSELSLAEIADVMGMKLSATKMRFYRALEKIKTQL